MRYRMNRYACVHCGALLPWKPDETLNSTDTPEQAHVAPLEWAHRAFYTCRRASCGKRQTLAQVVDRFEGFS